MFAKIENGVVVKYPILDIGVELNASVPTYIKQEHLPEGYVIVNEPILPSFNFFTHKLVTDGIEMIGESWFTRYSVVELSEEEVSVRKQNTFQEAKRNRKDAISRLEVTTPQGRVFDGDEDSQNRIGRAIAAMDDGDTISWVLADNSVAEVSRGELKEALRLAGKAMSDIWIAPYV